MSIDKDLVLDATDLAALITELAGPGRNRTYPCPSPHHEQSGRTPPVSIDRDGRLWNCHGCPAGGSAIDVVMEAHGVAFAEALAWLAQRAGITDTGPTLRRTAPVRTIALPPQAALPPPTIDPQAARITGSDGDKILAKYLDRRQWRPECIEAFGLFAVRGANGRARVRHPFRIDGETVWWQDWGRDPKWMSPLGYQRHPHALDLADVLDYVQHGDDRAGVVLVEGPADVIAFWHAAPDADVIGIPGTEGVEQWARMLEGLDVLVALDADTAGDRAAATFAAAHHATGGHSARVRPPDGRDIDEWRRGVGDEAFRDQFIAAAEAVEWWTPEAEAAA